MSDVVKSEPVDVSMEPIDLEDKIVELLSSYPDGISDAELQERIPIHIDSQQRAAAVNRLLAKSKLDLMKSGTLLLYKLKNSATAEKITGASKEETVVYRIIEEAQNKGIWVRDIRNSSNLPQAMLNKVLKSLESRKLVKSVKAVGAARKKVYMLFELEPDTAVSGGAFYSEQEFDMQFVDLLNQQCLKYLRMKAQMAAEKFFDPVLRKRNSFVQSTEVWKHINELKISKIELSVGDVEKVLDTVVYDGLAEKEPSQTCAVYRAIQSPMAPCGFVKVPCAFCPVVKDCQPKGIISPATCVYYKEWLSDT